MISRCKYKTATGYENYGARGISVCKEWEDFERFYLWALENGYSDELTIERKMLMGTMNQETVNGLHGKCKRPIKGKELLYRIET